MADIAIFRINYKSDFILTLNSDAGWMTPFCIKFWTGAPSQAYFAGYDGETYTHCAPVDGEPTKLRVQFDDHRLPIGDLKFQISYHFTVADFPTSVEDEVLNQASVIIEVDDVPAQVMLDLNGDTAPEIEFSLPAYANEAQRIANEQARIAAEQQRIANEDARIQAEETRQYNEQQRIQHEEERVSEFARLKSESEAATTAANAAATLANEKAQLADDKATLAQAAATLANEKAQLAADKSELAQAAATLANEKAALAQQKATYAQTQGDYAKEQGDYAKAQGDTAQADHVRAEADHTTAADDHSRAEGDHTTAASDHSLAESDHTTAASDHSRAESDHTTSASDHTRAEADHTTAASDHETAASDHTRAESDHAAVEVYVDSLGAFDISAYHATGGVLAKYADLTAALGTNGANIPDDLRKGGMSVKFVQSSDNKYVRFNYLLEDATTNSKFTDVANWQKIVDEEEISTIKFNYGNITALSIAMSYGYIKCNGAAGTTADLTPVSHSTYKYAVVACVPGDVFYIIGKGGNSDRLYCFVTSDDTIINSAYSNQNQQTYLRVVAPSNSAKIIINDETGAAISYKGEKSFIANSDDVPTPESNNLVKSGGIARYANTAYFVGKGNNYVTVEYGTVIVGHTYRIYPVLRSWDFATTLSSAWIFAISYTKTDDSVVNLYFRNYNTGNPIKEYIDVIIPNDTKDNTGLIIGGRAAKDLKVWFVVEDITSIHPSFLAYGEIGKYYGEQIPDIVDKLGYRFNNRFHFLHISDNHNGIFGYAEELLDFIPAKFLVNTGDLVNDKFSDSKTTTIAKAIAPDKPVYLVLGNHDYSHAPSKQAVFDAFYGDNETEGTVNYHNVQTGGVATDKTYYSVDFATEGIKCIMLDINDGQLDSELPDLGPNTLGLGRMSQTQINWFVNELQDAITNNLHVCIFIHDLPVVYSTDRSKRIEDFFDFVYAASGVCCTNLTFLCDIVDAFITGESVSFTYDSNSYSFTFSTAGHLVAWFAGHTHYDAAGWLKDHENQFAINVCRPNKQESLGSSNYLGTYDGDRLGVHFNYVTIDKGLKSLSIYRVGQQDTVYATQRKSFRILYK